MSQIITWISNPMVLIKYYWVLYSLYSSLNSIILKLINLHKEIHVYEVLNDFITNLVIQN